MEKREWEIENKPERGPLEKDLGTEERTNGERG